MRIGLAVERVWSRMRAGLMSSRLERLAAELGPVAFRTPEFLHAEMRLALAQARLAEAEYQLGELEAAERSFDRADQIYIALRRFLPHAELDQADRAAMESGME